MSRRRGKTAEPQSWRRTVLLLVAGALLSQLVTTTWQLAYSEPRDRRAAGAEQRREQARELAEQARDLAQSELTRVTGNFRADRPVEAAERALDAARQAYAEGDYRTAYQIATQANSIARTGGAHAPTG